MFANLALVSALALDGRPAEAREALRGYVALTGRVPPDLTALHDRLGWLGPQVERMLDGLREAGVAEG